jgi:hypothetical protein
VVYVGDDTKVANSVLGYRHNMSLYRLQSAIYVDTSRFHGRVRGVLTKEIPY